MVDFYDNPQSPFESLLKFDPLTGNKQFSTPRTGSMMEGLDRVQEQSAYGLSNLSPMSNGGYDMGFKSGATSPIPNPTGNTSFLHRLLGGDSNQVGPSNMDYLFGSKETGSGIVSPALKLGGGVMSGLNAKDANETQQDYVDFMKESTLAGQAMDRDQIQYSRFAHAANQYNANPGGSTNPGNYEEYKKNNPIG